MLENMVTRTSLPNRRRQAFQNSYFQCFQQLQWLPWDCQTLESTRKAQEPWVIAVGDSEG